MNANWIIDKVNNGWIMPPAPRWKRLPIIRHFRAFLLFQRIAEEERFFRMMGMKANFRFDWWIIHGIWMGQEEDPK